MLKDSENDEAAGVKKVVQTVAFFYAIGGVFLFLATLVFAGELLGVTSRLHTDDGSFIGGLVSLLYSLGPFIGSLLGVLLFGGIMFLFFAQVYGLWHMKRWSLYTTAASTILFFIFTLFIIANPSVSPYIGITSVISGFFLGYLYHFREHFK